MGKGGRRISKLTALIEAAKEDANLRNPDALNGYGDTILELCSLLETAEKALKAQVEDKRDGPFFHEDEELAASQAREARLRARMLTVASACRIWGGEAERARKMLEEALALPTDDSALQQQLTQEREKCAKGCEERHDDVYAYGANGETYLDGYDLARRIRRMK